MVEGKWLIKSLTTVGVGYSLTVFKVKQTYKNGKQMASRTTFNLPTGQPTRRVFSEEFRRKKVIEIEQKLSTVHDISREYGVTSAAIYKWIYKYSNHMKKKVKVIVEEESDTRKIALLKQQIAELEQKLGQKQIQLEFMDKIIDLAEETYQIDIKKKFGGKP